jgi:DNA gyrase subunit B
VKSGKDERYLKDDHELNQYVLRSALNGASLTPREGAAPLGTEALEELARGYLLSEAVVERLTHFIDTAALNAMLSGATVDLSDEANARASAEGLLALIADKSVTVLPEYEERIESWVLRVKRSKHGNWKTSTIDPDFVHGADYAQIRATALTVKDLIGPGAVIRRGEGEKARSQAVTEFRAAVHWLLSDAERNLSRQRYKGLGEMNPAQLWETTMDPTVRRLLRVQIEDAIAADGIFTTLMGDDVEPRRAFIESNALRALNIDV